MKAFLFLIRANFIHFLSYRAEAFASIALNLIPITIMFFLWSELYGDSNSLIAGVNRDQMVIFSTLAVGLKEAFFSRVDDQILSKVHNGQISIELIRPFSPLFQFLANDISLALSNIIKRLAPLLILTFSFYPDFIPEFTTALLFLCSLACSYASLWLINACLGTLAFRFTHTGATNQIKDQVIRILSGAIIPIWFFPAWAQQISAWLPFHYTYQLPLGILVGKYSHQEALRQFSIQCIWMCTLTALLSITWTSCRQRLQVQGG